jgi:sugar lactone lactonase YvrE
MTQNGLPSIVERKRLRSLTVTPQALVCEQDYVFMSSRDLGMLYKIHVGTWKIVREIDPPGVVWAAVSAGNGQICFTIGKGLNDDRYIYRYAPNEGFTRLFSCPDFNGSYLSFDGKHLYMSQWYKERILKFDDDGNVLREIDVGAEICGHTFVGGMIYMLRGRENKDDPNKSEEWRIARLDPKEENPQVEDLAAVPFAARSLTFDGEYFWSNHRAANETISFSLPS